ncbi:MAG: hypothetical protein ACYC3L_05735 [Gemmatimonadaceae bacterium]
MREDRVVITRGSDVRALGVGRRWVYAVTSDAVLVYDRDLRAWQPPYARDGGFEPSLVRAVGVDPDDDSAWLVTQSGAWTLQPSTAFLVRAPAGPLPARLRVGSLQSVYREFPSLQGFGQLLTRDEASLQGFPVVAGARAPDRTEVWLGTAGGGVFQVDPLFNSATSRPYGLAVSGAGAIARAADGVWIAPAPRPAEPRVALTFASRDLQRWRWVDDASRRGFGGDRATALDVRGSTAWMGSTRGLFRIALADGGTRAFTPMAGLPSDLVLSVLARGEGTWVGTARGLAFLPSDSAERGGHVISAPEVTGVPVRALLATGDTLWVGTEGGLVLRTPGEPGAFVRPRAAATLLRLRQPVRAIAHADSLVFVATRDAVLALNLHSGTWSDPWPTSPWRGVGDIEVMAGDARSVWVGGAFGVVSIDRATGASRAARTGSDLPDAVTGLVLDGPWAWVATLGGVVRYRRAADGLIP